MPHDSSAVIPWTDRWHKRARSQHPFLKQKDRYMHFCKKTALIILLALGMALGMMPVTGQTAYADNTLIDVSGTMVKEGDPLPHVESKWTFNSNPAGGYTLTLNSLTAYSYADDIIAYYDDEPLAIVLNGDSSITNSNDSGHGILSVDSADITIEGSGTLKITAGGNAIRSNGDIEITGGTVTATSKNSSAVCANNADVTISGGAVTARGGETIDPTNPAYGICAYNGNVTISGNSTTAEAFGGMAGIYADNVDNDAGNVTICDGTVIAGGGKYGICSMGADTKISGGTVKATADKYQGNGIYAHKRVNISGGNVEAAAEGALGHAVYAGNSVSISDAGTVKATATGAESYAILGVFGVSISGGAVEAKASGSDSYGIRSQDNTEILGGDVKAEATGEALNGYVINSIKGTGWTESGKETIGISTDARLLPYRKVQFPAEKAEVTRAPEAKTLTYDGSAQKLVTAGKASGGTMQYAVGTAEEATGSYSAAIPEGTEAGTYYVWYKAVGDADHSDSDAAYVMATISESPAPAAESSITYDLNGGSLNGRTGIVTVKAKNGSVITLPEPERDGYVFDYWQGSRYNAGDRYTVNGDHTFTAVWKTGGGSGSGGSGESGGSGGSRGYSGSGKDSKSVKTGDEKNLAGWITLMGVSALALAALYIGRKEILHR